MIFAEAIVWMQAFLVAMGMKPAAAMTVVELLLVLGILTLAGFVVWAGVRYTQTHTKRPNDPWLKNGAKLAMPLTAGFLCWMGWYAVVPLGMQGHLLRGTVMMMMMWLMVRALRILPGPKFVKTVVGVVTFFIVLLFSVSSLRPILDILDQMQITLGGFTIGIRPVLEGLFFLCVLSWLATAGASGLTKALERNSGFSPSLQAVVVKVFKFTALFLSAGVALSATGVDLGSLAIFGGALAIGIGWSLRPITSNLLSGFLLLLDRSIKPGDVISLDDHTFGQVKALHSRYVVLRRRDGKEVLIPNEVIMNQPVINWSYTNKAVRAEVNIPVEHDNDMEQVQAILKEAINGVARVQTVPAPIVFIKEFTENATIFIVRYWSVDPEQGVNNLKGDVNMACWKALKANGIEIPRGQVVVRMVDEPKPKKSTKKRTTK